MLQRAVRVRVGTERVGKSKISDPKQLRWPRWRHSGAVSFPKRPRMPLARGQLRFISKIMLWLPQPQLWHPLERLRRATTTR